MTDRPGFLARRVEAQGMRRYLPTGLAAALVAAAGLALVPSTPASSTDEPAAPILSLVEVHTDSRAERQLVADLGLDLTEHGADDHVGVVLHGADDARLLREHGLTWTVVIPDLVARERQRAVADATYAADAASPAMPSGRTAYRDLGDYEWDMRELAKRNPDVVQLLTLPHATVEGRKVLALELSENVTAHDGKPVLAVMGLHHAREWPSGEHTIEFAFDLVKGWRAGDARTRDLLRRARVVVLPVVNPDGFVASRNAAAILDGNEVQEIEGARGDDSLLYTAVQAAAVPAYKRKNCRTVDGQPTPRGACDAPGARQLGVDPNRNYAALWGGAGASSFPGDDIYRGPAPFSEPETLNVRDLVARRQVTMLVSTHTFAGLVLRAPGVHEHGVTVDEPAMKAIGDRMAEVTGSLSVPGYDLYDTTGTTEDWSYSATGGFGYTFEMPVLEFHPPFSEVVATWYGEDDLAGKGSRELHHIALETAADPAHHSIIAADAPPGAVLRLHKRFDTVSSPVRVGETQFTDVPEGAGPPVAFRDVLDATMLADGHVEWHVNPSTRPAVMERRVIGLDDEPSRTQVTEDAAPATGAHVDIPFDLRPDDSSSLLKVDLTWNAPTDDLDLELYRVIDGEPVFETGSGRALNQPEHVELADPPPGRYVARVIGYQSSGAPFRLTFGTHRVDVVAVHPATAPFETWALTCETPAGRVLQRTNVLVSRGDRVEIDLAGCRAAWPG